MNKILPTTQLTSVSVSKLGTLTCWRKYYWKYICNLEPKQVNLNYWIGAVIGAGFEQMLIDGRYSEKTENEVRRESRERLSRYNLTAEDEAEIDLQMKIAIAILQGAEKQPFFPDLRLTENQVEVSYEVLDGIKFIGIYDGLGTYKGEPYSYEGKALSRIINGMFEALDYAKQVYSYPLARKKSGLPYPVKCFYLIFRKPQKRLKKKQILEDFVEEIKIDLDTRPDFYYNIHRMTLGADTFKEVEQDIYQGTKILKDRYDSLTTEQILDPVYWPKNDRQCIGPYGACEYLTLCRHQSCWKIYEGLFQQRKELHEKG